MQGRVNKTIETDFINKDTEYIDLLREDSAKTQKLGIHFMLASIPVWIAMIVIQLCRLPVLTSNLLAFCAATPLVLIAYLIARPLGIQFKYDKNPLNKLGFLFTMNQMLYILIAMWAYKQASEYFLMIYAMIFGAHLLPYSWLYQCKLYVISSILVTLTCLIVGCMFGALEVAVFMLFHQCVFSLLLWRKVKKLA